MFQAGQPIQFPGRLSPKPFRFQHNPKLDPDGCLVWSDRSWRAGLFQWGLAFFGLVTLAVMLYVYFGVFQTSLGTVSFTLLAAIAVFTVFCLALAIGKYRTHKIVRLDPAAKTITITRVSSSGRDSTECKIESATIALHPASITARHTWSGWAVLLWAGSDYFVFACWSSERTCREALSELGHQTGVPTRPDGGTIHARMW